MNATRMPIHHPSRRAQRRLAALLVIAVPLLAACEDADSEFFLQLAADWAVEKGLMSLNCAGDPSDCQYDLNEVALGRYITLGRLGAMFSEDGQLINAALDGAEVVRAQEEADELAAAGTEQRDLTLIDQAIALRPGDWSYHDQRAALLLGQNDDAAAQASFAESERLVRERIRAGASCRPLMLNMLRHRAIALEANVKYDPELGVLDQLTAVQNDIADLEDGLPSTWCP